MKKLAIIAAASMCIAGAPLLADHHMEDADPMDGQTSPSSTPMKKDTGPVSDGDTEEDVVMPAPRPVMTPPPRTVTLPPPPMQYQSNPQPAATPSVPGGDYPVCKGDRQDSCINPGAV